MCETPPPTRPCRADLLWAVAAVLAVYAIPLALIEVSTGQDWRYFDSLSLVVRSSLLSYGEWPPHDPWIRGGLDVMANPQSRLFSPFGLLDLPFSPHTANLLSLVIYAIGGFLSMRVLLGRFGHSPALSRLGGFLFVAGSWFALHFTEGHIAYGCFQLMPLVALALLRLDRPRMRLLLAGILALMVLDGGLYAAVFSFYLALGMLLTGLLPIVKTARAVRERPRFTAALLLLLVLVTMPRTVPMLATVGGRSVGSAPEHFDRTVLDAELLQVLFHPDQHCERWIPGIDRGLHEFGCYLGIPPLLLFGWALTRRRFLGRFGRYALLALIWIWVGSNVGWPASLWGLAGHVPLLENIHVPSRVFILLHLSFVVLVIGALSLLRDRRRLAVAIGCVLLFEALAVNTNAWGRVYFSSWFPRTDARATSRLIEGSEWRHTIVKGKKPRHYYAGGLGCRDAYEPAPPRSEVLGRDEPGYRGEAFEEYGRGEARVLAVAPRRVRISYDGPVPALVRINQNPLLGWKVAEGDAEVVQGGLLSVEVRKPGEIEISYRPWYWPWVLLPFLIGLAGFIALWRGSSGRQATPG